MNKTSKNRRVSKINERINDRRISSLRKLGLESLEERQLLSASTLLEASAIAELTSNAAIVAQANDVAPIDLSNAVADETTLVVTTFEDSVAEDDVLSLREAVQIANNDSANQYTITFDSSLQGGTITLNNNARNSAITISQGMTIDASALVGDAVPDRGAATPGITISGVYGTGNNDKSNYLFTFDANSEALKSDSTVVTFRGLSLTGARTNAVNAENASLQFTLNVENSVISDNAGRGLYLLGGGETNLTHVTMENNVASASGLVRYAGGAAFIANGTANITDSVLANNTALTSNSNYASYGGALYVEKASVTIENTNVANNSATATASIYTRGGAIYVNEGELVVRDSDFVENATGTYRNSAGGAIYASTPSKLDVENSVFEDNESLSGAAIDSLYGATANIFQSTFSGNTCADADGSVIFVGAANITNVAVEDNAAPRAIAFSRSSGTYHSTISNSVINHAGDVAVRGGNSILLTIEGTEIRNSRGAAVEEGTNNGVGTLKLVNSLVADSAVGILVANNNHQTVDVVNTDIVGNGTGVKATGGTRGGAVHLKNSIVAMNGTDVEIGNCNVDANNTLSSFTEWTNASSSAVNYVYVDGDPLFVNATSGDYKLAPGAIAIDTGNNSYIQGYDTDFDGEARIVNGTVDLGMLESAYEAPSIIVTTTEDVVDPTDGLISLREAVEVYFGFTSRTFDATVDSTGQTITFDLAEPGDVVLENGEITISDSMAIYGGDLAAITIEGNLASRIFKVADGVATVDFQRLTFRHGLAFTGDYASGDAYDAEKEAFGGGAIYATTAAITVKRSEFTGNAGYVGGAIFVDGGTLSLDGATFTGNVSAYEGGAVALFATEGVNTASLVVSGTSFETNASDRSGAVYFKDGVATVAGSEFVQNLATYASGGAITASNSTTSLTDVAFVSNKSERFGGAIFAANSAIAINNGDGIAIDGNSAHYGGAIYASNDDVVVEAGSFTNNTATESGGAIFASGTLAVSGVFDGNEASKHGGAIYASATVDATDATFTSNAASGAGGAIYAISDLNVESAIFESNASVGSGGAIYATKSAVTVVDAAFKQNESALSGGAIRIAKATYATFDNATFEGNFATGAGGAIDVSATPNVTIAGGAFDDNSATNSGGAIYAASSKIDVTDAEFYLNSSQKFGGAVALVDGSDFTIVGGSIKNGGAMAGGAIYATNSAATISANILNNTSTTYGGAVYALSSDLVVKNTEVIGNTAESSGGAIYTSQGSTVIEFAGISDNQSTTGAGGAIYASSKGGTLTLKGVDFSGNKAKSSGGAVYAYHTGLVLEGGEEGGETSNVFDGNETKKFGGAIYVVAATAEIESAEFSYNVAKTGGAIYAGDNLTVSDATFRRNTASEIGGAAYVKSSEVSFEGVVFEENSTETNGGALYLHTTTATITEGEFAGNTSVDRGGAIIMIDGELTVSSSSFVRNASDNIGGAIYQLRGASTISNVSFNANQAKAWGGALYVGAGASTISGSTFTGNEASRGTAISSMAATSLEIDGEAFPATGAINDEDLSAALLDEAFAELFVEELD